MTDLNRVDGKRPIIAYIPSSHLDLFWLGTYKTCLERGADVIRQYLERCQQTTDETFLLETVVFAEYFLKRYPEYHERLVSLVKAGRVEIGAAYIDRLEQLTTGESHIRNIVLGKRWCQATLGLDNKLVTHPDLPGLISQMPQIYRQAGVRYYVTSRKLYPHGGVWRYRAPDGSTLLMLNYPRFYCYIAVSLSDIPKEFVWPWTEPLELPATFTGFPLGTVLINGGAGDLCDRQTFRERYGLFLEDFVAANRRNYPEIDFKYALPSDVLEPYEKVADLPEYSGEVPSVWGVATREEVEFFQRDRAIENVLLTAETLAAIAEHQGFDWRPPSSPSWQGVFYEAQFFAPKDPIPFGEEFRHLWRMRVFTQDHNSGGQEGVLSTFQKRVIQERCLAYSREIIAHTLSKIASRIHSRGDILLAFNPHAHAWSGPLAIEIPKQRWLAGERPLAEDGQALPLQVEQEKSDMLLVHVSLPLLPSVGYRAIPFSKPTAVPAPAAPDIQTDRSETTLRLQNSYLEVELDLTTGNLVKIYDRRRSQAWVSNEVGRLSVLHENGHTVDLRFDKSVPSVEEVLMSVGEAQSGELFTFVKILKTILGAEVEQVLKLWHHQARLDWETRLRWWGAHNKHLRMRLPGVPTPEAITYGSPFYSVGWTEVIPDAGPFKPDEVLPEDYPCYREALGWLHLKEKSGGLTICSTHPSYYYGSEGLEAVLLRTPASGGDHRFFWENAGEHLYRFGLLAGESDWRAAQAPVLGNQHLRPPVTQLASTGSDGSLSSSDSFLQVDSASVALSSLYPASHAKATVVRAYDMMGTDVATRLSGPLAEAEAVAVDFLEEQPQPLKGYPGAWDLNLSPWQIQTLLLIRK